MKGNLDIKELESYKKADLQKLARDLGVSDAGTIKEIAARCATVKIDIPDESETFEVEKTAVSEQKVKAEVVDMAIGDDVTVVVVARYLDKCFNHIKNIGEVFTVDRNRATELIKAKVAQIKE